MKKELLQNFHFATAPSLNNFPILMAITILSPKTPYKTQSDGEVMARQKKAHFCECRNHRVQVLNTIVFSKQITTP